MHDSIRDFFSRRYGKLLHKIHVWDNGGSQITISVEIRYCAIGLRYDYTLSDYEELAKSLEQVIDDVVVSHETNLIFYRQRCKNDWMELEQSKPEEHMPVEILTHENTRNLSPSEKSFFYARAQIGTITLSGFIKQNQTELIYLPEEQVKFWKYLSITKEEILQWAH